MQSTMSKVEKVFEEMQERLAKFRSRLDALENTRESLVSQRDKIDSRLVEIDEEVAVLAEEMNGSTALVEKPKRAKAAKGTQVDTEKPLYSVLVWFMGSRKLRNSTALAEAALEYGYKSEAKNFVKIVYNTLSRDKRFRKLESGEWGLTRFGATEYARQVRWNQM